MQRREYSNHSTVLSFLFPRSGNPRLLISQLTGRWLFQIFHLTLETSFLLFPSLEAFVGRGWCGTCHCPHDSPKVTPSLGRMCDYGEVLTLQKGL